MADYRLYFVHERGHFTKACELAASDDARAVRVADQVGAGRAMELWEHGRLVRRFQPSAPRR